MEKKYQIFFSLIIIFFLIISILIIFLSSEEEEEEEKLWVAVGTDDASPNKGMPLWSVNGKNWNFSNIRENLQSSGVAYDGKGRWVVTASENDAAGINNPKLFYSDNGKIWKRGNLDTGVSYFATLSYGVAYGKDKWVAVGKGSTTGNTVLWSEDGILWKQGLMDNGIEIPFDQTVLAHNVAYNGINKWIIAGGQGDPDSSSSLVSSTNGISWSYIDGVCMATGFDVAYGNNLWVIAGASDLSGLQYSENNGVSWKAAYKGNDPVLPKDGSDFKRGSSVAYNGKGRWVAGLQLSSTSFTAYYSDNGISWEQCYFSGISFFEEGEPRSVSYGNNLWILAVFGGNGSYFTSEDGISWSLNSTSKIVQFQDSAYQNLLPL